MVIQSTEVVKAHIPATPVVGVVPAKEIKQGACRYGQNVAGTVGKKLKTGAIRTYTDHSSTTNLELSTITTGCFIKSKISGGYIEPAVNAQIQAIGGVVSRAFLKIKGNIIDQAFVFLGNPIAITVVIYREVWRVKYIEPVLVPDQPTRRINRGDEFGDFVGPAVSILIA
jgi:hypothetical protein